MLKYYDIRKLKGLNDKLYHFIPQRRNNMILLYLSKNNKFKTKRFKNDKNLNNFIKKKGITHFYIDGYWVIR